MKKLITAMAVLLASAFVSNAEVLNGIDGNDYGAMYIVELDRTISEGVYDTINGATDSTYILKNFVPDPGWEYILAYSALTDGGDGDPVFIVHVRCEDEDGDLIYYDDTGDTLSTSGGAVDLEFGESLIGSQYDVIIDAGAANGAANHLLNILKLYKRRTVIGNRKRWD